MSLILDALKRRPRSAEGHVAPSGRTAQADVVLETLGYARRSSPFARLSEVGRFILYAVATLLLLVVVWAVI